MRGIPRGEYVDPSQEAWLRRVHPDDVPRIRANVHKQNVGEDGFETLEYRERHRDGHWIWILSRGRPVEWDADGHPARTIGTDTDITLLKTVEAELADEKERLRVTLQSIGDGVISHRRRARITFMNPIAEAMTGWPCSEAMAAGWSRCSPSSRKAPAGSPAARSCAASPRVVTPIWTTTSC